MKVGRRNPASTTRLMKGWDSGGGWRSARATVDRRQNSWANRRSRRVARGMANLRRRALTRRLRSYIGKGYLRAFIWGQWRAARDFSISGPFRAILGYFVPFRAIWGHLGLLAGLGADSGVSSRALTGRLESGRVSGDFCPSGCLGASVAGWVWSGPGAGGPFDCAQDRLSTRLRMIGGALRPFDYAPFRLRLHSASLRTNGTDVHYDREVYSGLGRAWCQCGGPSTALRACSPIFKGQRGWRKPIDSRCDCPGRVPVRHEQQHVARDPRAPSQNAYDVGEQPLG